MRTEKKLLSLDCFRTNWTVSSLYYKQCIGAVWRTSRTRGCSGLRKKLDDLNRASERLQHLNACSSVQLTVRWWFLRCVQLTNLMYVAIIIEKRCSSLFYKKTKIEDFYFSLRFKRSIHNKHVQFNFLYFISHTLISLVCVNRAQSLYLKTFTYE